MSCLQGFAMTNLTSDFRKSCSKQQIAFGRADMACKYTPCKHFFLLYQETFLYSLETFWFNFSLIELIIELHAVQKSVCIFICGINKCVFVTIFHVIMLFHIDFLVLLLHIEQKYSCWSPNILFGRQTWLFIGAHAGSKNFMWWEL